MTHPYHDHRAHKVSRSRVGHIMKSGGHPHSDAAADKKLFAELMAKHEAKEREHSAPGHKHGGRLDKYARGGKVKDKGKHQVNIAIVTGRHGQDGAPAGGPPMPPPRPPVGAAPPMPPGGPPGLPPGGPPPGMMPRPPMKRGGRVKRQSGGRTNLPPEDVKGLQQPAADTLKSLKEKMGRARGGKVGMKAGADSGEGRLQKIKAYGLKPKKKG